MEDFLVWDATKYVGLPPRVSCLVMESPTSLGLTFEPGRHVRPVQVGGMNQILLAQVFLAVQKMRSDILTGAPRNIIVMPIATEGLGLRGLESCEEVWPGMDAGGICNIWIHRERMDHQKDGCGRDIFITKLLGFDERGLLRFPRQAILTCFDIVAAGVTGAEAVINPLKTGRVDKLIYASPCGSAPGFRLIAQTAISHGVAPENIIFVAATAVFGLHPENTTYLSTNLPETVASRGVLALGKLYYPHPEMCMTGSGGDRANWPDAWSAELAEDERHFGVKLQQFGSLPRGMKVAGVNWPSDFGRVAPELIQKEVA